MSDLERVGSAVRRIATEAGLSLEEQVDRRIADRHERDRARMAAIAAYWRRMRDGDAAPLSVAAANEPPDALPPCETCHGARWVKEPIAGGEAWEHTVKRCPDCGPEVRAVLGRKWAEHVLGWDREQMAKTFATFEPRPGATAALEAARGWADRPDGWLVINGAPGTGKTHLSCAATNVLLERNEPIQWWYGAELAGEFYRRIASDETQELLDRLSATERLVVDDLGTVAANEVVIKRFLEPLFVYRERHRLETLVTCIGAPDQVRELLSDSIGRRFQDARLCRVVPITAEQYGRVAA